MFARFLMYAGNYLIIQASIVGFILPFYVLYRRRYVHEPDAEPVSFNRHLEYFFSSPQANYLVFFWAMGEAVVWFVIPEFLLLLLVFMRIKRKRQLLMYDIYGTVAGTIIALLIHLPKERIADLPYVQPNMIVQTQQWFEQRGVWGLLHQPFSGVPYKVFTHLAPDYHFFIPLFLLVAILARISRYYVFYLVLTNVYPLLHKFVYRHYVRLFLIATLIFSILLYKVYSSFGPGYHFTFLQLWA